MFEQSQASEPMIEVVCRRCHRVYSASKDVLSSDGAVTVRRDTNTIRIKTQQRFKCCYCNHEQVKEEYSSIGEINHKCLF